MKIRPARSLHGAIALPGDKSISHRVAMIAAMANGDTTIDNFATSADCTSTLSCLAALGVPLRRGENRVVVHGVGKRGFTAPAAPLDCGNSGTTMRLLAGILAGQSFESTLTGDESLLARPMRRIIGPLGEMGAITTSNEGKPPLTITGQNPLRSIDYTLPVASAQVKSCVLLAGLNADGETRVIEPTETRDHTERMLRWFGVNVRTRRTENGRRVTVAGTASLTARDVAVPADISSAAFFMAGAACLPGSDITMPGVGINPSRRGVLDVLRDLGANIEVSGAAEQCGEPVATLRIRGGLRKKQFLSPPILRGDIIANLIDEIPVLAVLGTQLSAGLVFRDAEELRFKETDRIAATAENLRRMGAEVTEFPDGLAVGPADLRGASIDSFGDHRIAMAFAMAGLLADGETEMTGADCADVSFPGFFEALELVRIERPA
ncbi:MAG TPA: 3-phosphoshikimate 1-carboxyvinyltransferase [Pyrinomonadaceae bacterium]|nr:3-phosphoshikimate 1-carboxyvinyltransferase [Pyrinomonadaceae bacterium]